MQAGAAWTSWSSTGKNAEPAPGTEAAPEPSWAGNWLGSRSAEIGGPSQKQVEHEPAVHPHSDKANGILGAGSQHVQGKAEGAGFIQPGKEKVERYLTASSTSKRAQQRQSNTPLREANRHLCNTGISNGLGRNNSSPGEWHSHGMWPREVVASPSTRIWLWATQSSYDGERAWSRELDRDLQRSFSN